MKPRFTLSVFDAHALVYARQSLESVIARIRAVAPPGYDGLRATDRSWEGPDWESQLAARDPLVFQHVLPRGVRDHGWTKTLLALGNPAFHVGNEGFQAWYRVAAVVTGWEILGVNHV